MEEPDENRTTSAEYVIVMLFSVNTCATYIHHYNRYKSLWDNSHLPSSPVASVGVLGHITRDSGPMQHRRLALPEHSARRQ